MIPTSEASPWRAWTRVVFLRSPEGTLLAAEVHAARRWDASFLAPPDATLADVRIVFLEEGDVPRDPPRWLVVAPPPAREAEAHIVTALARDAWPYSPHYRVPSEAPDAWVRAAYHALCPPHPACPVGPHARATVLQFLRGRPAPLGLLAHMRREAADRLLQTCWSTPEALARAILVTRLDDAGAGAAADLIRSVEAAQVGPDGAFGALADERKRILAALDPTLYFTHHEAFVVAVEAASGWWARYLDARRDHRRRVVAAAELALQELAPALAAAAELRALNRDRVRGGPVGAEALARLEAAVEALRLLDESGGIAGPQVTLGGLPEVFAAAHYDAAGVLAALEVQRRRAWSGAPS